MSVETPVPLWVRSYLAFLGLSPEPPSLEFLGRLLHAHLHRVPFENISKLHYYRRQAELGWRFPPSEVWAENVRTRAFGGTCFTINSHLHRLLAQLGYDARLMRASGGAHLTVGVRLGGRLYLVDPGVGAPLFAPVDLAIPTRVEQYGRGLHVYPMAGEPGAYHMDHYQDGERKLAWTFTSMPEPFEAFGPNVEFSYQPTGYFMVFMTCSLYQADPQRHLALRNSLFTVRLPDGSKTTTELKSVKQFEEVLAEEFRLPGLPVRDAIETLSTLGVDVFAPPQR